MERPAPNALQEADLVGPRHLAGAIPFYACNAVDLGRRAAACELQPNKTDAATAASLVRIWGRLGIPVRLKLDNWLVATLHHSLPLVVWLCLALGDPGVRARPGAVAPGGDRALQLTPSTSASSAPSASGTCATSPWTPAEVTRMRQDVKQNTPTRVIGVHLGRPEGGVRAKAQELGISLRPTNWSPYGTKSRK